MRRSSLKPLLQAHGIQSLLVIAGEACQRDGIFHIEAGGLRRQQCALYVTTWNIQYIDDDNVDNLIPEFDFAQKIRRKF